MKHVTLLLTLIICNSTYAIDLQNVKHIKVQSKKLTNNNNNKNNLYQFNKVDTVPMIQTIGTKNTDGRSSTQCVTNHTPITIGEIK